MRAAFEKSLLAPLYMKQFSLEGYIARKLTVNRKGSCPLLVNAELIGVICLKLCTCLSSRDNLSIYLFTKSGHEPHYSTKHILQ